VELNQNCEETIAGRGLGEEKGDRIGCSISLQQAIAPIPSHRT
jgi:hypothetical protein